MPPPDTIEKRVAALSGQITGRKVRLQVPYEHGTYAEVGTVTSIGYPTVAVDVGGGQKRYRHIDQITIL